MKIKIKLPKKSDEAQSSQIVASINHLLTEILLRLPIKSLIRFKLVSKNWHALITNPTFCHIRSLKSNSVIGLFLPSIDIFASQEFEYFPLCDKKSTNTTFGKLNFGEDPFEITIMQSCNGLLLCRTLYGREIHRKYYVHNPTTNNFSTLPELESRSRASNRILGMTLAFDPARSPYYRVICTQGFETDSGEHQYQIQLYSSETGPWRVCGEPFTAQPNFAHGVYWNGAIHWINEGRGDSLYFNIEDEVLETMPMPPFPDDWDSRVAYYFGETCGHLHYIDTFVPKIKFNVFELKRDYSEWFVKYQVDLSPVAAAYPGMIRETYIPEDWEYYAFSIICLVRGQGQDDSFLVLHIPGKIIRYYLGHGGFKMFHEFEGDNCLSLPGTNGFQYIESLCCV